MSQVISGGEDAEEKIAARKRQQETQIKWGDDGKELPSMVTGHAQGPEDHPKSESSAIIAQKAGVSIRPQTIAPFALYPTAP